MAPGSCTIQKSPCVNLSVYPIKQDELAGAQDLAGKFNANSNETPTLPEALTPPFVPLYVEDLFTKFIKMFIETTKAQHQILAES